MHLIQDDFHLRPSGLIRVRNLPDDCTEEDFKAWWPRLSEKEKNRFTSAEFHNLVTTLGKNAIVNYLYVVPASGTMVSVVAFGQKFAIGNGSTASGISAGDTGLFGEVLRKTITSGTKVGVQIDYSIYFGPTDYTGLITNAGVIGGSSGTDLLTHFACNYTKGSGTITFDYLLNLV